MIVAPKNYTQFSDEALMKVAQSIKRQMFNEKQRAVAAKEYKWIPTLEDPEKMDLAIVTDRYSHLTKQLISVVWELGARDIPFDPHN